MYSFIFIIAGITLYVLTISSYSNCSWAYDSGGCLPSSEGFSISGYLVITLGTFLVIFGVYTL